MKLKTINLELATHFKKLDEWRGELIKGLNCAQSLLVLGDKEIPKVMVMQASAKGLAIFQSFPHFVEKLRELSKACKKSDFGYDQLEKWIDEFKKLEYELDNKKTT